LANANMPPSSPVPGEVVKESESDASEEEDEEDEEEDSDEDEEEKIKAAMMEIEEEEDEDIENAPAKTKAGKKTVVAPKKQQAAKTVSAPSPASTACDNNIKLPTGPSAAIGQYMIDVNRPLNSTQIVQKFKDKLTKAAIDKAISQLVSKDILAKDGSANLYWVNQSLLPGGQDAKELDAQIASHSDQVQ